MVADTNINCLLGKRCMQADVGDLSAKLKTMKTSQIM